MPHSVNTINSGHSGLIQLQSRCPLKPKYVHDPHRDPEKQRRISVPCDQKVKIVAADSEYYKPLQVLSCFGSLQ